MKSTQTMHSPFILVYILVAISSVLSLLSLYAAKPMSSLVAPIQPELVQWATELYPFDTSHTYRIQKNQAVILDGKEIIPAGSYYIITVPGEKEARIQEGNSGRKIGSTSVDLSKYEEQDVTIEGKHYLGAPLFLVPEHTLPSWIRSEHQAVIHISSVTTSEDKARRETIQEQLEPPGQQ